MVTLTHLVGLFAPGFAERWTYLLLCQPLSFLTSRGLWGPGSLSVLGVSGGCCWCQAPLLQALHQLLVPAGFGSVVSAAAFTISLLVQQSPVFPVPVHTSYGSLCCSPGLWLLASGLSWGIFTLWKGMWCPSAALQPSASLWTGRFDLPATLMALRRVSPGSPWVSGVVSNSWLQSSLY